MGTTRFDETWWIKGHEVFGAHEERGLLRSKALLFKDCLLLQNNPKSTKPTT